MPHANGRASANGTSGMGAKEANGTSGTSAKGESGKDPRVPRGRSIRRRLYLLVAIPLLTVIGLYAFVLDTTVGDAINLGRAPSLINVTSVPTAGFIDTYLAGERRASLVYLAAPTAANRAKLDAAQAATERAAPALRATLTSRASTGSATASELAMIRKMVAGLQNLSSVRTSVDSRTITPAQAFSAYNALVTDEFYLFLDEVRSLSNATSALQSLAIVETTESHQFLMEEDSLVSAALAAHKVTPAVRVQVAQLAGARRAAYTDGIASLDHANLAAFMGPFRKYAPGATMPTLTSMENAFAADPSAKPPFPAAQWDPVAAAASKAYYYGGVNSIEVQGRHDRRITLEAWLRVALAGGLGLVGLIGSVIVSTVVGRRIARRLARLRDAALRLAGEQLPAVVARLRRGEDVDVAAAAPATAQPGSDEIGQVSQAFDAARRTAIQAAVDEARLRRSVNDVFRNLARRSQSLLHRQLTLLDTMERRTTDPGELEDLFRLDHLTTRMRRHAEGLIILSGAAPGRGWVQPVRLIDVLRGAVAEVEDYARVTVVCPDTAALAGPAVGDVIHLLAELIENATTLSPPYTQVRVTGGLVGAGFAVEIEDRGLGMSEERYAELNARLAEPPEFDLSDSEQLGLFVVAQLARRHGIQVTLRPSPFGGTTAIALIPNELVVPEDGQVRGLPAGVTARIGGRHAALGGDTEPVTQSMRLNGGSPPEALTRGPQGNGTPGGDAPPAASGRPAGPARPAAASFDVFAPIQRPGDQRPGDQRAWEVPLAVSAAPPAPQAPASAPPGGGIPDTGSGSYKGLPRRVRQASLAPQLRDGPQGGSAPPPAPPPGNTAAGRSPEEIRAAVSAMQHGWERGRATSEPAKGDQ